MRINSRHNQKKLWESLDIEEDGITAKIRLKSMQMLSIDPSDSPRNNSFSDRVFANNAQIKLPKVKTLRKKEDRRKTYVQIEIFNHAD